MRVTIRTGVSKLILIYQLVTEIQPTFALIASCPLKRVGDHNYGFVHASMIEYFATRAMYEEISLEGVTQGPHDNNNLETQSESKFPREEHRPRGVRARIFARMRACHP